MSYSLAQRVEAKQAQLAGARNNPGVYSSRTISGTSLGSGTYVHANIFGATTKYEYEGYQIFFSAPPRDSEHTRRSPTAVARRRGTRNCFFFSRRELRSFANKMHIFTMFDNDTNILCVLFACTFPACDYFLHDRQVHLHPLLKLE